jgi:hypothetical protein
LLSYYKSLGFETFDYNRKSNLYYMVKAIWWNREKIEKITIESWFKAIRINMIILII